MPTSYAEIVRETKSRYALRVRRWRNNMSGCAWQVRYADGRMVNWIEAPYPRTPVSLAVFLHEVGHHAIGFDRYAAGCEEELHVWNWALDQMRRFGVEPDARVQRRFDRSMQYAVGKALRRGVQHHELPEPLHPFLPRAA